jgi:hypothetical protein
LKPRYFLLEVAKAIAGPVAVLGLMWTIVVGISQQGALQQSKEDERFDKAVTRLAGPSPTERLTGLAGLQLFLEPEYKSRHRGTLSFLVNALASESDATVRGALLDTFSRLTRLDVNQSVMNETLERLRDQNRSLLALRKDPSLATAKGNDETGMGQLSQEDLAPLRATATAIAVLIRHGAVTQDLSEIYCESCDFSGKTLDMSRPDYANTANFAQWHGADLSETDFHNAILKNANFTGLFLRGHPSTAPI